MKGRRVPMSPDFLRLTLADLALSQVDFARLIEVTPRAVNLWLSGKRAVPGPVKGYLRLFSTMPEKLRKFEMDCISDKGTRYSR